MKKFLFVLLAACLWSAPSFAAIDLWNSSGPLCTAEHLVVPTSNISCSGNYATLATSGSSFTGTTITGTVFNNSTSTLATLNSASTPKFISIDGTLGNVFSYVVTTNMTVSATNLKPGFYALSLYSQGTSSLTVSTTGTNIKTSGVALQTGATSGKAFAISYFSDGQWLFEINRSVGLLGAGM